MHRNELAEKPMFNGVARPHWFRDVAVIALWLALSGGFIAHAVRPAQASPQRQYPAAAYASTTVPQPCADVRVQ